MITIKMFQIIRKDKENTVESNLENVRKVNDMILNIGSSSKKFGKKCINLDIQKNDDIDLIADAHELPFAEKSFNICILSAVLQYCHNPFQVAKEIQRVLINGGIAIIDAPFIQPYCYCPADLYRFSKDGLKAIFGKYLEIIKCDVSISAGSALAFYLQNIIRVSISNKYLRFICTYIISLFVYPLSFLKFCKNHEIAGAFILLAIKKEGT